MNEALARRGVSANVFIVGGAAMAIAYDARRTTRDVDAIFEPSRVVRDAVAEIAQDMGLESDWLNDAAKGFIPGDDPHPVPVYEGSQLKVAAASPEFLLAMKLLASRTDRDIDDIKLLYNLLGYSTADEGLDLLERFYPRQLILPRVSLLLEELFPSKVQDLDLDWDI